MSAVQDALGACVRTLLMTCKLKVTEQAKINFLLPANNA